MTLPWGTLKSLVSDMLGPGLSRQTFRSNANTSPFLQVPESHPSAANCLRAASCPPQGDGQLSGGQGRSVDAAQVPESQAVGCHKSYSHVHGEHSCSQATRSKLPPNPWQILPRCCPVAPSPPGNSNAPTAREHSIAPDPRFLTVCVIELTALTQGFLKV